MSINSHPNISISIKEASEKEDGKRCVDGYKLEVSNNIPRQKITGRTDYFEGINYELTFEQAEELYRQLGESLAFIKPLISSGQIISKS